MEISQVVDLISSLGFPIVCCVALFWYMIRGDQKHKEEIDQIRAAVDNNTLVLTELVTMLHEAHNASDLDS